MNAKILFDTRWIGEHGIGRFAKEVFSRLENAMPMPQTLIKPSHLLDSLYTSWAIYKNNPALYFSPGYNPPRWCPKKTPYFFTIHDLTHLKIKSDFYALKKIYYEYVIKPAMKKAETIFVASDYTKNDVLEWSGIDDSKISIAGYGVSAAFVPSGVKAVYSKPYFLYIGNRKPHKNLPLLLTAFSKFHDKESFNVLLSGVPDSSIMHFLKKLNLANNVIFLGDHLSDDYLATVYRGAFATIMPSLYEGVGLPALESMACGTPVIVSQVASLPEVVGEGGLFFDPYETDALVFQMEKLVQNTDLYKTLSKTAITQSQKFSWEKTANTIKTIFHDYEL